MRVVAHHAACRVWILAAATALAVPALPLAQQGVPSVDRPTMAALLGSSPGTFVAANGRLTPAGADAAVPMFVQADAYRRTGRVVQVPVVIGAEIGEPWSVRLQVSRTGAASGTPAGVVAEASLSGAPGRLREVREFAIEPGDYEATAVLIRGGTGGDLIATVVRASLTVPDLSGGTLTTSPIVLGERAETVPRENIGRPFVFGSTNLIPASTNTFRQDGWLHAAFRIYGWQGDDEAKPDLTIEYVFYQRMGTRLRFFNKTQVQTLSSQSLGATFDGTAGVIGAGTSLPLGAFPPGQFELDVRILDKRTKSTFKRRVAFLVVG